MSVAINNEFKVPTEVDLQYEHDKNNFTLYSLIPIMGNPSSNVIPINISSDSESGESCESADSALEEIVVFARSHQRVEEEGEAAEEDYRWTKEISDAFAKGKSVLHFPSKVCNTRPFSKDHQLKIVNGHTNYTVTCTVTKASTEYPQFKIGGAWYDFIKKMKVKEKDTLSFVLDHPPTVLTVWKE
ncbi:unnamed protein product [Trifolium pratense]|uniref:Uncharacterized protein n=1 Tax=Trifolium pratense TaxID=57577 RepID=A0ACB0IVQ0_TRIPR|nr:unnamed protein product [Trifolium pratense]